MRILIVEDEIKIRTGMSKLISAHTAHTIVGEAKNGKEGLELILRLHPDLVISDIRMPVMDGLEMQEAANRAGVKCHFIILSGYSEFEYAQKALRYGADDYLLKPLAAEDVTEVLEKIQNLVREEEKRTVQSAEGLLRDILLGGRTITEEDYKKLERLAKLREGEPCYLAAGCLGDANAGYAASAARQWEQIKSLEPELRIVYTMLENTQEMFCLIQGQTDSGLLAEKMTRRLYRNLSVEDMPVWAVIELENLRELKEKAAELRSLYLYGMLLGYRTVLTKERAQECGGGEYQYPAHLEGKLKVSICNGTAEELKRDAEAFMRYVRNLKCSPVYFRKAYGKMIAFMENVCSEVNPQAYRRMQESEIEKTAATALTIKTLEDCFRREIEIILSEKDKKEDIRNYTIRRAINFIREHYRENISLELLAEHLEITPEYLSTLFNKEVGINFTTFLKRFRISHAKRLLKGSSKKIYEISEEVGYHDPKYFNRVFKEEVGVSPGDYRQMS
ncbi:response regulator receiver domain protein [Marvinbryantia formatexigens DSM 14469]|uniref:Stage 0 sporulation protein A homolog n=1 Tax=Marvinbryantia formatexigens DSM 14469 TaxID=478749 RepID=C6LGW7_9FIRM|nr:response regulator [Marvinbryantia formatexigens]EET60026.1 response regulator receiver domain protein [Marvinbryantia formatexigens DSM 14469]UWO23827.1 response regulator [Marvinbryantia formatexigens DSM 14469]SDF72633.1 two-component system, response regulator YesN [Marvinbryantia formatexigens]